MDTHFVLVSAESPKPRDTAVLVNAVAAAFVTYHLELEQEMYGDTLRFLQKEKEKEEKSLLISEAALQAFREVSETITMSGSSDEKAPVIKRLNELNSELTSTQLERIDLTSQLKIIKEIVEKKGKSTEERNSQLFCRHKRFVPGSGGVGQHRGGLGQEIMFECESERPIVGIFMTERTRIAAPGFSGGGDGQLGTVEINGVAVDSHVQHVLNIGDTVTLRTPGGGGYGDPDERPAALIESDKTRGYV
jgi:hypothetical protein